MKLHHFRIEARAIPHGLRQSTTVHVADAVALKYRGRAFVASFGDVSAPWLVTYTPLSGVWPAGFARRQLESTIVSPSSEVAA